MSNWVYSLTPTEEAVSARIGWERQLPFLGQPQRNRNYSEGDIWESWQHMITASSELAAARMLGYTDFLPHVNTFKTVMDVPGYEVRYSFSHAAPRPKYSLRYTVGVDDPEAAYILIVGGPETKTRRTASDNWAGPAFRAIGWMSGTEMMQTKYRTEYGVGSYSVPAGELHEMSTLPEPGEVHS